MTHDNIHNQVWSAIRPYPIPDFWKDASRQANQINCLNYVQTVIDSTIEQTVRQLSDRALDPDLGVPFDQDHDVAIVSAWIQGTLDNSDVES